MRVAFFAGMAGLLFSAGVSAEEFDWRTSASRQQMNVAFNHMAIACSSGFGFTRIPALPPATMANKLHAYLLLHDDAAADAQVQAWAEDVMEPVMAMVAKKSTGANADDEHRAAAAAVAAAEDPSTYEEAKSRYMEGAMTPFRRGLDACAAGAHDPFLGKYYWSGSGSIDDYAKSMEAYFSELVAGLKKPKTTARHKR